MARFEKSAGLLVVGRLRNRLAVFTHPEYRRTTYVIVVLHRLVGEYTLGHGLAPARLGRQDKLGFTLLFDDELAEGMRWVHLTPSEDAQTSITLVHWFDDMPPGSVQGLILLTEDIEEAHAELSAKGVVMEPIQDYSWGKFAEFKDPDGNGWSLRQEDKSQ